MPVVVWGAAGIYCPMIKFLQSWGVSGVCGVSGGEAGWGSSLVLGSFPSIPPCCLGDKLVHTGPLVSEAGSSELGLSQVTCGVLPSLSLSTWLFLPETS